MTNSLKVEFIDKMGTDLSVVNAARVSYAKFKEDLNHADGKCHFYIADLDDYDGIDGGDDEDEDNHIRM